MKQLLFSAALILSVAAHAQSDKYTGAMKTNLEMLDSAKTPADYQAVAATFERIGDAEKTQWEPYYWAGLALTRVGWMYFPDEKGVTAVKADNLSQTVDELATRINSLEDKADAAATSDSAKSEIFTIRNMAATQQMIVDPQNRYMTYGAQAGQDLQKALQLNPNNPRAYYLQGMSIFSTPAQFGGGKDKAKPVFEKAVDLGTAQAGAPKSFFPHWSLEQSQQMLGLCQ